MSTWNSTRPVTIIETLGRDDVIVTGARTTLSIKHTTRTGPTRAASMLVPKGACLCQNRR